MWLIIGLTGVELLIWTFWFCVPQRQARLLAVMQCAHDCSLLHEDYYKSWVGIFYFLHFCFFTSWQTSPQSSICLPKFIETTCAHLVTQPPPPLNRCRSSCQSEMRRKQQPSPEKPFSATASRCLCGSSAWSRWLSWRAETWLSSSRTPTQTSTPRWAPVTTLFLWPVSQKHVVTVLVHAVILNIVSRKIWKKLIEKLGISILPADA